MQRASPMAHQDRVGSDDDSMADDPLLPREGSTRFEGNQEQRRAAVRNNMMLAFTEMGSQYRCIAFIYGIFWVSEIIASTIILSKTWNLPCDEDLRTWVLVMTSRLAFEVPLSLFFITSFGSNYRDPDTVQKARGLQNMLNLAINIWLLVGITWVSQSTTCSDTAPVLYRYSIAMCVFYVFLIVFPCICLLSICLCFPCIFLLLRHFGPRQGASDADINNLETISYKSDMEDNACSICFSDYAENEQLRRLPCHHTFHTACVDHWLRMKTSCPLCRHDINEPMEDGMV